jgi:hypothetical protein
VLYRIKIQGLAPKTTAGYPAAYRIAQELANVHACRINIEQDCGRLGWITCEWCEPCYNR